MHVFLFLIKPRKLTLRKKLRERNWSFRHVPHRILLQRPQKMDDTWLGPPSWATRQAYEFFLIAGRAVSITSHPLRPSTTHRSIHFGYKLTSAYICTHTRVYVHTQTYIGAGIDRICMYMHMGDMYRLVHSVVPNILAACTYVPDRPAGLTPNLSTDGMRHSFCLISWFKSLPNLS